MTALVAWLWQGLALTAAVALLLRAMPRLNAATRHIIWWAALAGVLVLAAIHGRDAAVVPAFATRAGDQALPTPAPLFMLPLVPGWLFAAGLGAWVIMAVLGLGRLACAVRHVATLRAHAVPLDAARASRLRTWSRTRRDGRRAQLCVTPEAVGACALGFRRPVILVSRHLADALDDEILDQVVMHEQAHLDRFDDWLRVVQAAVSAVAAIHPAVRLIVGRIDLEREAACDDRVVSLTGAARRYAACLAEAATVTAPRVPTAVPGVLGGVPTSVRSLRARIVRLLDPRPDRGHRLARPAALGAVTLLAGAAFAAPRLAPLVVFAHAEKPPASSLAAAAAPSPVAATAPVGSEETGRAARRDAQGTPSPAGGSPGVASTDNTPRDATPRSERVALIPERPAGHASPAIARPPADPAGVTAVVPPAAPLATSTVVPATLRASAADAAHAQAEGPVAAPARWPAVNASKAGLSRVGRSSASTARRMGLSLAGAVTRVGQSLGNVF